MSIVAVQRALIILKEMAASSNGIGVREVARTLGYSPAVVQKSLQALVSQGFARQDPVTQHYHLGPAALQVGLAGLVQLEIRKVARPHIQALAETCDETVFLGIREDIEAIYIDKEVSPAEIRMDAPVGARRPLNCTAIGKALLAYLPEEELELLARKGAFVQATPNSVTDLIELKLELAKVRERGLATDQEEFLLGAMCLAAPIRNHEGTVVAAVTLSGPIRRLTVAQEEFSRQVIACASDISADLGYQGQYSGASSS